jgi:hypothetical protein
MRANYVARTPEPGGCQGFRLADENELVVELLSSTLSAGLDSNAFKIERRTKFMREDERLVYGKLIAAVQGEDMDVSLNAAMKLVAKLIVSTSPSLAARRALSMQGGK